MKRILVILLVCIISITSIVPISAEVIITDTYIQWDKDTLDCPKFSWKAYIGTVDYYKVTDQLLNASNLIGQKFYNYKNSNSYTDDTIEENEIVYFDNGSIYVPGCLFSGKAGTYTFGSQTNIDVPYAGTYFYTETRNGIWVQKVNIYTECDLISCGGSDSNCDNICDKCGRMILSSLRSRLLDYAHWSIENANSMFNNIEYSLVTIGDPASNYNIYISSSPFTYNDETGNIMSTSTVYKKVVSVTSSGSFEGTSWSTISANTPISVGACVDSSHDITDYYTKPPVDDDDDIIHGGGGGSFDDPSDDDGILQTIINRITSVWEVLTNLPSLIVEKLGLKSLFDNITSRITDVFNLVTNLPSLIVNGFNNFFESIGSTLNNVWNAIVSLPDTIGNFISSLFVPDADFIQYKFNLFKFDLESKFNVNTDVFESLFDNEETVKDEYIDYKLHGMNSMKLKVFDSSFLVDGVVYFRPFIRGFLVLLMMLYHVKQVIGFFGYDAGVITGHIRSSISKDKGE